MVTLYDSRGREIPSESRRMMLACLRNWLTDRSVALAIVNADFELATVVRVVQQSDSLSDKALAISLRNLLRSRPVRRAIANHTGRFMDRSARVALKDLLRLRRDLEEEYALG